MTGSVRRGFALVQMVTVTGAIAVMGAAGPAAAAAQQRAVTTTGWPQFQRNGSHTGFEARETSVTRQNAGQLSVAWTAGLPSVSDNSEVAVIGGVAYAGSGDAVTAFNVVTGAQLWQATLPGAVLGTPAVQGGMVLVAYNGPRHRRGWVVALNASTGAVTWSKPVGVMPGGPDNIGASTSITTTPTRAYVTLQSGQVDALSMARGFRIWQSPVLPGCDRSQPSVANRFVVIGSGGTDVVALHASDGTVAWHETLGSGCGTSAADWLPAISQGTVYAGLLSGVAALSLASGTVLWDNQSVTGVFFPLSVTSNAVIAGPNGGDGLVALSRTDGSVLWTSALSGQVAGTATFGDLTWGIYQPGGDVEAVAFGRFTGHRVFSSAPFSYTDTQGFPPVVDAGHVYVNLGDRLLCLALPASS